MSYDTDHVRSTGDTPVTISGVPTFTELLSNTALASVYTSVRRAGGATGPELAETASVSKKTVYEYLHRLERAGLVTETDADDDPSVYEAATFELTLTVRDVAVSVTPALVEVVAHADEYPVVDRVLDDHGLVTFALAHDLARAHSDGEVTVRQIASLTGLSVGTAYDILEAMYEIRGLGDDESDPTTYRPSDFPDEGGNLPDEDGDLPDELTDS